MFKKVKPKVDFIKKEHEVSEFWKKNKIEEKYLKRNEKSDKHWSFLDGPITANNPMGVHHAWGRTLKDVFQRYKNMQGYQQRFQNGFDCQGLWVEVEVEKELEFKTKKDIEAYGVDKFVNKCKERVIKYSGIQTEQSKRLAQFMDWDDSYFTMSEENNYAIWHFLKKCNEKGYLYKGLDSVPWCARCGTALSQHEILSEEYKEIVHTAIYFRLPIVSDKFENTSLLVWTTTPWTIPANVAVAMSPDFEYGLYKHKESGEQVIILKELVKKVFKKQIEDFDYIKSYKGSELEGVEYTGAFDDLKLVQKAKTEHPDTFHKIIMAEDMVTAEEGTGMIHIAPGAGKEDFDLSKELDLSVIAPIDGEAKYIKGMGEFEGKSAKADPKLIFEYLKQKDGGKYLYKLEDYKHRYPTCWRCKEELVWRVVDEWYISMDELRYKMMEVTKKISWLPKYGLEQELDWLKNMHDWMISKKRYWGLALPIYQCKCGNFEVIGSREELKERAVEGWEEFEGNTPHKPWIDKVKIKCSKCDEVLTRIPDVGNPWLDAGIVPYSTLGYFRDEIVDKDGKKKSGRDYWEKWFPADLILESFPGQFKNWFYSLIAMSTVLEEEPPYKTILGHGLVKDEKGAEMHKSSGNAIWFDDAAEKMGVDVMRYMYVSANPFKNLNFGYNYADAYRKRVILLWNVYSFFTTYATIDKFDPSKNVVDFSKLSNKLDRYIISLLHETIQNVTEKIDEYDVHGAMNHVEEFLESLANWYVRRSRRRFWKSENDGDKNEAYHTLYHVLVEFNKLLAPIMPYITDEMYQNLVRGVDKKAPESIHLVDYPVADEKLIDKELNDQMRKVHTIVSLGHATRDKAQIKVRQPLASIRVAGSGEISDDLKKLLADELNVKDVEIVEDVSKYAKKISKLDFSVLGKRIGKDVKIVAGLLAKNEYKIDDEGNMIIGDHKLSKEEFSQFYESKDEKNFIVAGDRDVTVVLDVNISEDLRLEGVARDVVRFIQDMRKEADYDVDDRIKVSVNGEEVNKAIMNFKEYIMKETLAVELEEGEMSKFDAENRVKVADEEIVLRVRKK